MFLASLCNLLDTVQWSLQTFPPSIGAFSKRNIAVTHACSQVWDAASRVNSTHRGKPGARKASGRLQAKVQRVASLEAQVRAAEEAVEVLGRPSVQEALRDAVALAAQEAELSARLQTLLGEVDALQVSPA